MSLNELKAEMDAYKSSKVFRTTDYYQYPGYREHYLDSPVIAKAHSIAALFTKHPKHVYKNNLISGSIDAMNNPDGYSSLVTRVAVFSAYHTTLRPSIQKDILERTEY